MTNNHRHGRTLFIRNSSFELLHSFGTPVIIPRSTPVLPYNYMTLSEQPVPARARFRTIANDAAIPIEAEDLIALARRYADQEMYDESIHLYEMAEKLKPGSVALRINLARVRDLKRQAEESRFSNVRLEVGAERARDEIDASQYLGLAQYYIAKEQISKAIELLEITKLKTPNNYRPFEILGR